ncbi:protein of unknown function (plasmid) [Caballeronia sp. S22]
MITEPSRPVVIIAGFTSNLCFTVALALIVKQKRASVAVGTASRWISRAYYFGTAMGDLPKRSLAQHLVFDAGHYARAMSLPTSPAAAVELALAYHLILEALREDCGNEDYITSMMQLTLKTMLVGESSGVKLKAQVFHDAQEGIVRCRRSARSTGSRQLDQVTYESLCKVVATFERQLVRAPFYEFMLAEEELKALIARRVAKLTR